MKNEEILRVLNEIDNYMIKNVQQNGKVKNNQDIFARMHLGTIQQIRMELESKNVGEIIKNRIRQTENALLYATDRAPLNRDNKYLLWLNCVKQEKSNLEPNYMHLFYDICTGHESNFTTKYIREWMADDSKDREALIYNIEAIQKEYDDFRAQDKETALVVRKRNPIQRLFDRIFKREAKQIKREQQARPSEPEYDGHEEFCKNLNNIENYRNSLEKTVRQPAIDSQPQRPEKRQVPTGKKEIIVISDLHGKMDRWQQVKNAMAQNPNMKVVILGDAMDRGDNGLEILLQIKELSDQGRVEYLPGNHDTFAYNYVRAQSMLETNMRNEKARRVLEREKKQLERNGGKATLNALNDFDTIVQKEMMKGNLRHRINKEELIDWLGSQPIQKKARVNGIDYALAHAYFDDELYNYDKNFNLEKGLQLELTGKQNSAALNRFRSVMWYRENDERTHYSPVTFPKGCLMIVGHTPQQEVNIGNFKSGEHHQVLYIDTGKGNFQGFNLSEACSVDFENEYER